MKDIPLKYPITFGEGDGAVEYKVLTMRMPKVKQILAARKGESDADQREKAIVATCCGVPASLIDELYFPDYEQLLEGYDELTGRVLPQDDHDLMLAVARVAVALRQPLREVLSMSPDDLAKWGKIAAEIEATGTEKE